MTDRLAFEHDAEVVDRLAAFLGAARPLLRKAGAERERGLRTLQDRWESLADGGMAQLISDVGGAIRTSRSAGAFANPWRIAGLRRREVPTATVLGWFLSPDGDHGAGDVFLQAFWREAMGEPPFPLRDVRRCGTELVPLADETNRIDLVLEGDDCVVFIEVKIDAPFQPGQLTRYLDSLRRRRDHLGKKHSQLILIGDLVIPDGVHCMPVRWGGVARALRAGARQAADNAYAARLACDFADHLEAL